MKRLMTKGLCIVFVYFLAFSSPVCATAYWYDDTVSDVTDEDVEWCGSITLPINNVTIYAANKDVHVYLHDCVTMYANDAGDSILNLAADYQRTIYVYVDEPLTIKHSDQNHHKVTLNQLGLGTTKFIIQAP